MLARIKTLPPYRAVTGWWGGMGPQGQAEFIAYSRGVLHMGIVALLIPAARGWA